REKLDATFAKLAAEIRNGDVFVFFIAGHGRTIDGRYYFVPQDFRYRDEASFAEAAIAQEQWQKWFSSVAARKSVLIYDTCESGTVAADDAPTTRGLERVIEQASAIERLRRATGKLILAASTDDKPALEGFQGHGVFSYAILEGLQKATVNKDGLIE